ncbi:hypothetical protein NHQ30_003000 [Ciborinia camelliae]|nr:hypothetical protein NHQ30_003000 [Ciborinia camelliae]
MEVYKSIYDEMLSKAISYGYVEQQVLDILSESHDRVELIADESNKFPGRKPEWKGRAKYLKHKPPTVEEATKNTQDEAGDSPTREEAQLIPSSRLKEWRQLVDGKASEATTSAPKKTARDLDVPNKLVDKTPVTKGKQFKPFKCLVSGAVPTSGANKRKRTETRPKISALKNPEDEHIYLVNEDSDEEAVPLL